MSRDENIAVARRYWEEIMNRGELEVTDEIADPRLVIHHPDLPDGPVGAEGVRKVARMYRTAFPDLRFTIEDLLAEGDKVVSRVTLSGTHLGPLHHIPPTGREVAGISGIVIDRFENGKLVERWGNFDNLRLMQQLGTIPPTGSNR